MAVVNVWVTLVSTMVSMRVAVWSVLVKRIPTILWSRRLSLVKIMKVAMEMVKREESRPRLKKNQWRRPIETNDTIYHLLITIFSN